MAVAVQVLSGAGRCLGTHAAQIAVSRTTCSVFGPWSDASIWGHQAMQHAPVATPGHPCAHVQVFGAQEAVDTAMGLLREGANDGVLSLLYVQAGLLPVEPASLARCMRTVCPL